ncbi:MAG: aldose 1-epimerase family protein [Ruminococcus sp.]
MKRVLENDFLKVTIDDHGAELVSIYDKEKDREVIWQGDPRFWGRHAPVLFPNVGKHYGNHYRIGDKEYASKQHGFARDTDFTCIDSTLDSVTHQIRSTEETKEVYPFDFVLRIRHILKGRTLTVSWKVANNSDTDMYFAIGGHPAFRVPVLPDTRRSDYRLTFDGQESLTYLLLDPESGTAKAEEKATLKLENGTCQIEDHMFDHDALVFDNQITRAGIQLPDGTPYLELRCVGFPISGSGLLPRMPHLSAWSHGWDAAMTTDSPEICRRNHLSII